MLGEWRMSSGILKNKEMKKGKRGWAIFGYVMLGLLIGYIIYTFNLTVELWKK